MDPDQKCVLMSLAGHLHKQKNSERLLENCGQKLCDRQTDSTDQHTWQNFFFAKWQTDGVKTLPLSIADGGGNKISTIIHRRCWTKSQKQEKMVCNLFLNSQNFFPHPSSGSDLCPLIKHLSWIHLLFMQGNARHKPCWVLWRGNPTSRMSNWYVFSDSAVLFWLYIFF